MWKEDIKNEFSWSKSRDAVFRECLRKYYYTYYGSWGGWKADAPGEARELYVLKKLQNRYIWIGSVVHDCVARTLKNIFSGIRPLATEDIVKITVDKMRSDFASSRRRLYRHNPKTLGLFEHEYELKITGEEWRRLVAKVERCLVNFYGSSIYAKLRELPREEWLETEVLSCFHMDGTRIYCVLDCSFRDGEDVRIMDWKTGRIDQGDINVQLTCYAIYARQKWGASLDRIKVTAFNLSENTRYDLKLSPDLVYGMKEYIKGSVSDMKKLLSDPARNIGAVDKFPQTNQTQNCRLCNFRGVCLPER